jgi:formylglycine-generating enzyme required for sulfatase activity
MPIDGGMITLSINEKSGVQQKHFYVDTFQMSKYPVTNGQYRAFLEAADGYANADWWSYSSFAQNWRANNPEPMPSRFSGDDRPRETVTWYDAIAFTRWLSSKMGKTVSLPTSAQWQRAAQGDESRLYPWGDNFDANLANTRESNLKTTTPVNRYPDGASPFGIFDMAGNVWEWCLNTKADAESHVTDMTTTEDRAVYGGAFVSPQGRSETTFHYYLNPQTFYASLGFRLVIGE